MECPRLGAATVRPGRRATRAAAVVAPCREPKRDGDQNHRRREQGQQRPPPLAGVRTRLLREPDRREPGEGAIAYVAHDAHHVREAEERPAEAVHDAGVLRDLGGDGRHSGEEQADGRNRSAQHERPGGRQPLREKGGRGKHTDGDIHPRHCDQGREGRRMDSHRQGSDQLEPPGLLVAAGEPADHEQAHQGYSDHRIRAHLKGNLPAKRVEALRRTVEGDGSRVVLGRCGGLIDRRLRREKRLRTQRREQHQERYRGNPDRDPEAVAPQDQADQLDGPCQLLHARASRPAAASAVLVPGSLASSSP